MAERKPASSSPSSGGASRGGGLFTGIFIGILIGVGAALAVAVWLNLHGSPFSEREAPAELPPIKPPAEPPKAPAGDADGAPLPAEPGPAEVGPDSGAPSGAPVRDATPARTPVPDGAVPPRISLPVGFYLQAGAFRNAAEAEDRKAHLSLLGESAVVQRVEGAGGTLHRIRVGPFANQAELERARDFLRKNGIDSIPMRPEAANTP